MEGASGEMKLQARHLQSSVCHYTNTLIGHFLIDYLSIPSTSGGAARVSDRVDESG